MEGLIFMVITFIVGTIINAAKNKQQQNQKPMPPFNNQPTKQKFETHEQPKMRKSLEDFANEVFQQLNEKTQTKPATSTFDSQLEPTKVKEAVAKNVETLRGSQSLRPTLDGTRSSTRNSTISAKDSSSNPIKDNEIGHEIVPTTRRALMHAIITSEILGPPKAKQR